MSQTLWGLPVKVCENACDPRVGLGEPFYLMPKPSGRCPMCGGKLVDPDEAKTA